MRSLLRAPVALPLLAVGGALLLLAFDLPLALLTVAWLIFAVAGPGALLVEALLGDLRLPWLERAVYAPAGGFALFTLVMLALSYLPGGLAGWQVFAAFGLLNAGLAFAAIRGGAQPSAGVTGSSGWEARPTAGGVNPHSPISGLRSPFPDARLTRRQGWALAAGVVALLAVAGSLRLWNGGYAEFHGDEARAVLRAAAVVQGHEDILLVHKKGPGEILVPAAGFAFAGRMDEASARLPFAVANMGTLLAALLLGWRIFGPAAGGAAALLLALDGYYVAFSRFVQYQSFVLLLGSAAVLAVWRLHGDRRGERRVLAFAALCLGAGLLYHYDALLAGLPVAVALVLPARRDGMGLRGLLRLAWPALAVGLAVVALFYLPFVLNPRFQATLDYLLRGRLSGEGGFPRNNVADVFRRTAVYSSAYSVATLVVLGVAALLRAYRTVLRGAWFAAAGSAAVLVVALTAWRPAWGALAARDLTGPAFVALLLPAWFGRRLGDGERMLWWWFGLPLVAALFAIAGPKTHVHIFFLPWALLAGSVVQAGWDWLAARRGARAATLAAGAAAVAAAAVFGAYVWLLFASPREVLLNWESERPRFYPAPATVQEVDSLYGFALNNGWKVPGALYAAGELAGDYESNNWNDFISAWYTRGQERCASTATWWFAAESLEPWAEPPAALEDRVEAEGFTRRAGVTVQGRPALAVFSAGDLPLPDSLDLEDYAAAFDALATPDLPLAFPALEPQPPSRLDADFGGKLLLEGAELEAAASLRPGDALRLTLYWRALDRTGADYTVTNQAYGSGGVVAAQKDAVPVCGRRPTARWRPGEPVVDAHTLTINEGTPPGVYPLYTALYDPATGARLPLLDTAGNPVDDKVQVGTLNVVAR